MSIANDIWAQRKAEREARKEKRREIEKRLHDEYMRGTPRAQRANQFSRQVLAMLRKYVPDACVEAAHDDLILTAFEMDIEITAVPPERDAEMAAQIKAASLMACAPQIIMKGD